MSWKNRRLEAIVKLKTDNPTIFSILTDPKNYYLRDASWTDEAGRKHACVDLRVRVGTGCPIVCGTTDRVDAHGRKELWRHVEDCAALR